jgi:hypothetical protein
LGKIWFEAEFVADGEEEAAEIDGLVGVVGELFVEAGGGFALELGAVGVVFDGVAEGLAQAGSAGVGTEKEGGRAGGRPGADGEAGLQGNTVAHHRGEAGEEHGRVGWFAGRGGGGVAGGAVGRGIGVRRRFGMRLWRRRGNGLRFGSGRGCGFGPLGEGAGGGGAGQLHGEVSQLRAQAQVARSAFFGFGRLAGRDGVQGFGSFCC